MLLPLGWVWGSRDLRGSRTLIPCVLIAAPQLAHALLWNPDWGMERDWSLFAYASFGAGLLLMHLLRPPKRLRWVAAALLIVSTLVVFGQAFHNHAAQDALQPEVRRRF